MFVKTMITELEIGNMGTSNLLYVKYYSIYINYKL